jgi:lipoyl(octanoyl) transferase
MRRLSGVWLGRRKYEPVHDLQRELVALRQSGAIGDTVLFVEHEPVVTLGRGAKSEHVLVSPPLLAARGVDYVETGRGGDVTLHAPGQLVCYPILDLSPERRDVRRYVRDLEETMRRLAADFGIASGPVPGMVGMWVDRHEPGRWQGHESAGDLAKIGAIGVRISRWITMHGYAFNLCTDLELFGLIVPCGISRYGVTSVAQIAGSAPSVESIAPRAFELLGDVIGAELSELEDRSRGALNAREQRVSA